MQFKSILVVALAAVCCTSAMAGKPKKQKKDTKKTVAAATLTPALKSVDGKTFSYALGVAQGESFKQYLVNQMGVDTAYMDDVFRGIAAPSDDVAAKKAKAFAAGLQVAEINKRNLPMIAEQATSKNDSTYMDQDVFVQGLKEAIAGKSTISRDSATKVIEAQFKYKQETWKNENTAWLTNNAKVKGVKTLPSGLQYSVRTEGKGAIATDSTEVEVNYEGKLIDGTVFDSSYKRGKAATFRPNQVIKGWKEALTMMPEGSVWELYIPSELGYGEHGQGRDIPGNSTLIFTVEVMKVKNADAAAKAETPVAKAEEKK